MSTLTRHPNWISLANCPVGSTYWKWFMAAPVVLNGNEILIVPFSDCADFLYKYNIKDNKWMKWIKYPNDLNSKYHTVSLNEDKTILYIFNQNGNIIQVNLKTKEFIKSNKTFHNTAFASSLYIDKQFHIFGGWQGESTHFCIYRWNEKDQTLERIPINVKKEGLRTLATIYIPSKKSVLIIPHNLDLIYLFSMISNEFESLPVKGFRKCWCPSAVITKCKRFIIIFGTHNSNDIQILDLKCMQIRSSNIESPLRQPVYTVIVSDDIMHEMLIFGFIRKCWTDPQFDHIQYLPIYLIKTIGKWYSKEMIHILNQENMDEEIHWKINVDDILK